MKSINGLHEINVKYLYPYKKDHPSMSMMGDPFCMEIRLLLICLKIYQEESIGYAHNCFKDA
jgi:hypothetical protein